ncbi:MAG: hypothetical protein ABIV51_10150 [Saprospiraceae bacterium]
MRDQIQSKNADDVGHFLNATPITIPITIGIQRDKAGHCLYTVF